MSIATLTAAPDDPRDPTDPPPMVVHDSAGQAEWAEWRAVSMLLGSETATSKSYLARLIAAAAALDVRADCVLCQLDSLTHPHLEA